jgi:signal transduction histidine kinase
VIEILRGIDLFAELSTECLHKLESAAHEEDLAEGHMVVQEQDEVTRFGILTEGTMEWVRQIGGEEVVMATRSAVTYFGAMSLLTQEPSPAGGRIVGGPGHMIAIPGDDFRRLLRDEPSVLQGALRVIAPVHQGAEAVLREREKLIALGTLSAGLAHELNNPAAAARRSASDLADAFEVLQNTMAQFVASGIERSEAEGLIALQREALARSAEAGPARGLDDADLEDALADALDARGLEGWRLAPALAEAALDEDWITRVEAAGRGAFGAAIEWVVASLSARGLVNDLHASTGHISEIVAAVKDYSHMDQAQTQVLDVHDGIETTLTILGHKIKKGDVTVERDYDRSLPQITAHPSQLNQVWTNLIDNALHAMGTSGELAVVTRRDGEHVVVEVVDSGPGIPPGIQAEIWKPFFTTKGVGEGTGLGLHLARNVIVQRHRGTIELDSRPGRTCFRVTLPIR